MGDLSIGEVCISSVCIKEEGFMDYRFAAYRAAEDSGFKVIRNPEDTGMTQTKFGSILKQHSPVFILLIGEAKSEAVYDECRIALERGLPVFAFLNVNHENANNNKNDGNHIKKILVQGEKYISPTTQKIMTKISRITYNNDCAVFASCEELYNAIRYRLNDYIDQKLRQNPIIQYNKGSTYYYAYEQILAARKRIICSQRTSLLILGPRRGNDYERRTYETIFEWIRNMDKDMNFLHLFCWDETIKALKESDEYDINMAETNLKNFLSDVKKRNGEKENPNLTFRAFSEKEESVSHLITDTGFQLVLPIAGEVFNLVLPCYFTSEDQLMKIITYLHTKRFVGYNEITDIYEIFRNMKRGK